MVLFMLQWYGKFTCRNTRSTITDVLIDSAFKTNKILQPFFQYTFLYGHTYYILSNILH